MDYKNYMSPYSWRYGTDDMRLVWSEHQKRLIWRRIWVALAETQMTFKLVSEDQVNDLKAHMEDINVERAIEIEGEIHHDVMAEIKTYAEQCQVGGGIIHLGATSMDVVDNTDALRVKQSLDLILKEIKELLLILAEIIEKYSTLTVMAYTHIQPAEPTTLGYRFSQYAQDIHTDFHQLNILHQELKGKGFKGAVGTGASYSELLGHKNLEKFEQLLSEKLDLNFFPITTQTYPRKQDYQIISALAGFGSSLNKLALDLRILQSPPFGELSEPFGTKQVGSSAMPFKRNPIKAEKTNSLARLLAQMPRVAWDNAANSLLERTLDDSANRRTSLAETFLICSELLKTVKKILTGLKVNKEVIKRNMYTYGPFAATERVLMALGKAGANRQEMHELIRSHAMKAWEAIRAGTENPLITNICSDVIILKYLAKEEITSLMNAQDYVGFAPQRAQELAKKINEEFK